jgi:hypothetical protein
MGTASILNEDVIEIFYKRSQTGILIKGIVVMARTVLFQTT